MSLTINQTKSWLGNTLRFGTDDDGVVWFVLNDAMAAIGVKDPTMASRLRKKFPESLAKCRVVDSRGQRQQTNIGKEELLYYIKARHNKKPKEGFVYGFITMGSPTVFKFGRCCNWGVRKKSYIGLNKPRHLFFLEEVGDQIPAEKKLLKLISGSPHFTHRYDLGTEWFESDLNQFQAKAITQQYFQQLK